jgi:predicted regulator of Ras-like GTPase activity (Roadblock/LC7/MglB family)
MEVKKSQSSLVIVTMIPNTKNDSEPDQEIENSEPAPSLSLDNKLLEELRHLRSRAGIRMSIVIGYDGAILGIHEDAAYVPKRLRQGQNTQSLSSKIDKQYFSKWSTSIHRTIEFVSEKIFESGVKFILLEGTDQTKAIIVNMKTSDNYKGKSFLLVGILPMKGTVGLAYQEMKEAADRIAKILQELNSFEK